MKRRCVVSVVTFALACSIHAAASTERCAVAVVADEREPFAELVAAELRADVACVDVVAGFDDAHGRTVVRVVSRRSVEIWEKGALAGLLTLADSDEVDAVKVAEHVRARALAPDAQTIVNDLEGPRTPPSPPASDRPPARAPEPTPRAADRVLLGAGIGTSLEGSALAAIARLDARVRLSGPVGAGVVVGLPLASASIAHGGSEAEISTLTLGVSADALFGHPGHGLSFRGGLAGMLARASTSGFSAAPLEGRRDAQLTAVVAALGSVGFALTERFALTLDGLVGAALPGIEIRFAGERVASWGAPYALLSTGGRVTF